MRVKECNLNDNISNIKKQLGSQNELVIRKLVIGKNNGVEAAIIYINGLVNKDMIDRDILNPLMLHVQEDLTGMGNVEEYLYKKLLLLATLILKLI